MESINPHPGKYIIAVSGGVDSVVLLDMLNKNKNLSLVVGHVDHGIRDDSAMDAEFVAKLANKYKLPIEIKQLELGQEASEELARDKRYNFLRQVCQKHGARALITAHHQDDAIETAIINLIRGTGYRGLASLKNTNAVIRPMLNLSKDQILAYAKQNKLTWREDSTNKQINYLRNRIRHQVVAKMDSHQIQKWLHIIETQLVLNDQIDKEVNILLRRGLHKGSPVLNRAWFNKLPHDVSKEIIRYLLVSNDAYDIDKKTIERVVVQIKTLNSGKVIQVHGATIALTKRSARIKSNSKTDKKRV